MEDNSRINGNINPAATNEEESTLNFKTIFAMFILNWQWIVMSMVICVCIAFIYLRYKSPVYQVSVKMLIKEEDNSRRGGANQVLANMQDFGFISSSTGIDNEVEILRSHILANEAVKDLKLNVEYRADGKIKDHLIYKTQPINVDLDPASLNKLEEELNSIKMRISKNGDTYEVTGNTYHKNNVKKAFKGTLKSLPGTIKTELGTLTFTQNIIEKKVAADDKNKKSRDLHVTIVPSSIVAARYINSMTVAPTSKTTSIALMTIKDFNVKRAEDFLKQLADCYNRQANADKNEIAVKTEEFINGRLEKIDAELGTTEGQLEDYKRRHNLTNLRLDATETLAQASQYSTKLAEARSQIQLLDYLREYVDNPDNKYQIIPSNVGLADASSIALINRFNQSVLDRNRMLRTASEIAPQVMTQTSILDELQRSIRVALLQARRSADIQRQGIENQYHIYQSRVVNTPEQERILTQIGRQQEVKSGLYLMLLQKREENSISLAATADKGKLIDIPMYGGKVSPKGSIILLLAIILGFGIPFGIIYLIQLLRYKIEGHEDLEKLTHLPIIADVAVANESAKDKADIVVKENQNNQIDEIFRGMRTNIQFMLKDDQKVIMFTSSTSGEGKTFNAANIAMSFALLGKKVILLGLDIRKPALGRLFGIKDRVKGITPLLIKNSIDFSDISTQIQPSGINSNLDLMLAGPIPPNPAELLAGENLKTIIKELKNKYDYIILDTAPVGLVTDTLQIGKLTDISIMVCRADYTPKNAIELLNNLAAEQKLPNMCIVLNGIDMSKKKYGYYYGYGKYGKYGRYGRYGSYGGYGNYSDSHYGNKEDNSIKK